MTDKPDLLASRAPASATQTHAEIEAMLRAENIALREEVEALRARLEADGDSGDGKALADSSGDAKCAGKEELPLNMPFARSPIGDFFGDSLK